MERERTAGRRATAEGATADMTDEATTDLDGLLVQAVQAATIASTVVTSPVAAPQWPSGSSAAKQSIAKIGYSHDAMIDLLIANPTISQNQLAAHFGYTASWVSQVMASDAFQMRMAERREQIVDPTLRLTVEENFKALVLRSLDILRQKLDQPINKIPEQLVLRTLDIGGRLAGYGIKKDPVPQVPSTEIHLHLEELGTGLVHLLHRKKAEVQALPPPIEAAAATAAAALADLTSDSDPDSDILEGDFTDGQKVPEARSA